MDIDVQQLDQSNNVTQTIRLYDAYPLTMADMDLSQGATDQVHKLNLSFAFRHWKTV